MVWNIFFRCQIWKLFKKFAILCKFLFDLFTNKARKLKVAESNQAKAGFTKPWLVTDEANRSPATDVANRSPVV